MKKVLLAAAALATLSGTAFAADIAPRTRAVYAVPVAAVYNWTGCYVGGNGGGFWAQRAPRLQSACLSTPAITPSPA